jgi:hypothetical protein
MSCAASSSQLNNESAVVTASSSVVSFEVFPRLIQVLRVNLPTTLLNPSVQVLYGLRVASRKTVLPQVKQTVDPPYRTGDFLVGKFAPGEVVGQESHSPASNLVLHATRSGVATGTD